MRHKIYVELKINFEKINSVNSSIIILKRTSSLFSSVKNKIKNENRFKNKKNVVRISKIKLNKKIKRTSKNSRSKECLTSSNMIFVSVVAYNFLSKQKDVKLFVISFKDIDDQFQKNIDTSIDLKIILSEEFHDLIDVFFKSASNKLTSHKKHDHKIKIEENQKLEHSSLKEISFRKLDFVKKYFKNNLKKEFIIVSHAFCSSSILLIKKPNDELKFCVNYRKFNIIIKKDRYSISLITKTVAQLSKIKIFFKIDIC